MVLNFAAIPSKILEPENVDFNYRKYLETCQVYSDTIARLKEVDLS